ncbi:hypothetical protein, partial [uncultured Bilophila sp.]|uniref:hypothetical protein n=1 Tax=uncultured Bilophila sp. TaxID=529385 RepID=UPI00280C1A2B
MGKLEKKAVFSLHCGDETTTCHNRAFWNFKKYNINPSYGTAKRKEPPPQTEEALFVCTSLQQGFNKVKSLW